MLWQLKLNQKQLQQRKKSQQSLQLLRKAGQQEERTQSKKHLQLFIFFRTIFYRILFRKKKSYDYFIKCACLWDMHSSCSSPESS